MTLGALEIKKIQRYLQNPDGKMKKLRPSSTRTATPLSGKTLARRLKGLISKEKADQLERHINESCEQIDD
jgi:hypothetical protein